MSIAYTTNFSNHGAAYVQPDNRGIPIAKRGTMGVLAATFAPRSTSRPARPRGLPLNTKVQIVMEDYSFETLGGGDVLVVSPDEKSYRVTMEMRPDGYSAPVSCRCPQFGKHGPYCKHTLAVARRAFPELPQCYGCTGPVRPHVVDVPATGVYGPTVQISRRCIICGAQEGTF